MFYKYEIKNNGHEDILYLYLSLTYEFSRELALESSDDELSRRTRNFIRNNNINYKGSKVYLVIDGIVVKSLDISEKSNPIEILKESLYYSNEYYLVTVRLNDNAIIEMPLKEYLLGVLATNIEHSCHIEVIKAISILYRTYVFDKMNKEKEISAYNDFVIYKPISYYKLIWTDNFSENLLKFEKAINDTDCLFLSYQDKYILPFIHFSNTGKTYSHAEYPYLSSVKSLWDLASPYYIDVKEYKYDILSRILGISIDYNSKFDILDVDKRNYIKRLSIDNRIFAGEEFKQLLGLKSMNLSIIVNKDNLRIITKGFGNGYGLSIYGANELAKNGCSFSNILKYYFPGVKINKYIKELS